MVQRIGLILGLMVVIVGWAVVDAQPGPQRAFLPVLISPQPRLETLALQRADLPTSFSPSQSGFITNEEEANTHTDPAAALAAFTQQGRELAYSVSFSSQAFAATGALAVSDKVVRYTAREGALAGQEFARAAEVGRGYELVAVPELFEQTVGLRRFIPDPATPGGRLVQYLITIQRGRYVTFVQVLGRETALELDEALVFARKAAARLPNGPSSSPTATTAASPTIAVTTTPPAGQ